MKLSTLLKFSLILMFVFFGSCGGEDEGEEAVDCQETGQYEVAGLCVDCTKDAHCPTNQICSDANECDCPEDSPYLDGEDCVQCKKDAHCGEKAMCDTCNLACVSMPDGCEDIVCDGLCMQCLQTSDCEPGQQCDLQANTCLDTMCGESLPYLYNSQCVECIGDAHCAGQLVCDAVTHLCECPDPSLFPVDGQCVQCATSSDCGPGQMCNNDHVCEALEGQCPPEKPFQLGGNCVECLDVTNCPAGSQGCTDKNFCLPPPLVCGAPLPHEYDGECVECLGDQHCAHELICKSASHSCEEPSAGNCVYQGNGTNIGNQIGDFTLKNCDGDSISLHDYCGDAKAVWFVLVAGWCGACEEYAPMAEQMWKQFRGDGLQLIFVLGENMASGVPTPGYCKQWKQSHGVSAPVLIDGHWQTIDSKISPGGFDLPWEYLLDGDDMTFEWESVNPMQIQQEILKLLAD